MSQSVYAEFKEFSIPEIKEFRKTFQKCVVRCTDLIFISGYDLAVVLQFNAIIERMPSCGIVYSHASWTGLEVSVY